MNIMKIPGMLNSSVYGKKIPNYGKFVVICG